MNKSMQNIIILGISGILGSLVLFAGDMLFYYNGDETNFLTNMANISDDRVIASGLCALVAAWLYTLGAGQIYIAFKPAATWARLTVSLSFASIMIAYGVIHGAYIAIATTAINAQEFGMAPDTQTSLALAANQALRNLTILPFIIFTVTFIYHVWVGKTHYPRWMILLSPIFPLLANSPIVSLLQGHWFMVIAGGYLNFILTLFFTGSTVALMRSKTLLTED